MRPHKRMWSLAAKKGMGLDWIVQPYSINNKARTCERECVRGGQRVSGRRESCQRMKEGWIKVS